MGGGEIIIADGESKLIVVRFDFLWEASQIANSILNYSSNILGIVSDLHNDDIKEGQLYSGEYSPMKDTLLSLLAKFGLKSYSLEYIAIILMWSSYSIGMIVPGRQAFYSEIEMEMYWHNIPWILPLLYAVNIKKFHVKYNLLYMNFECFSANGLTIARGRFNAFIRQKINQTISVSTIISDLDRERLQGKTVLITGASRGLGAILAKMLAAMSCHVIINFQYSLEEAVHIRDEIIKNDGTVELWQGDVSNFNWLNTKKNELLASNRTLDILICNACQAPKVMSFNENTVSRINTYISKNIELVSVPLSLFASFVNDACGFGIIISSEFVSNPQEEFPQYISVKAAIEGLISSIALKFNSTNWLIVRPTKMLTDMSNSPTGNRGLVDPVLIAKQICNAIISDDAKSELIKILSF
jgi:short-subunit dehydrogenase